MPDHRICYFLGRNRYAAHAFFQIPDFRDDFCIDPFGCELCDLVLRRGLLKSGAHRYILHEKKYRQGRGFDKIPAA